MLYEQYWENSYAEAGYVIGDNFPDDAAGKQVGLSLSPLSSGAAPNGPQDLHLDVTGSLALVFGAEAIGQHVRQRLKTHEGEWFLDTDAGVPWLRDILGKNVDLTLAEAVTKAEILDTEGVTEITGIGLRYDRTIRSVLFDNIDVATIYETE